MPLEKNGIMEENSLKVEGPDPNGVAHLFLNRPSRHNALDHAFFRDLPLAITHLDDHPSVRVIVLQGSGENFCSGIDLSTLAQSFTPQVDHDQELLADGARVTEKSFRKIQHLQAAFTALEECRKPVIAAVHGACIGAGVDMITACDLRYCSADSYFSVKEVDLAIVADLGTLQRLPRLIGFGSAMELALTGRKVTSVQAKELGLVHDVFMSKNAMEAEVNSLARNIAAKSPLAIVGTKKVIIKSRDLPVKEGLEYVALWNSSTLMSSDLKEALQARLEKRKPVFSRL